MKAKFERMLDVLDVDFVEDNPEMVVELIDALVHELNARKDVIQLQREELLLLKAMVESNK
jgi:hypothetical protein